MPDKIRNIFFIVVLFALFAFPFYSPNKNCKAKGGTYFLNGDCVKIKYETINQ